jgi:hypothetical protein
LFTTPSQLSSSALEQFSAFGVTLHFNTPVVMLHTTRPAAHMPLNGAPISEQFLPIAVLMGVCVHVPFVTQASFVHALLSLQFTGVFTQTPVAFVHVSVVQRLPSEQFFGVI